MTKRISHKLFKKKDPVKKIAYRFSFFFLEEQTKVKFQK